jgi:hypothetical protein
MMTIPPWNERAVEDQSLFNPPFCSLLLRTACKNFAREPDRLPMPLPLAFLILPIVLNQRLRDTLPTLRTLITTWAASNPQQVADFGERARDMAGITREAIQFGCAQRWLAISGAGLAVGPVNLRPDPPKLETDTEDVRACYAAARFLGRWLPSDRRPATVMLLLGVAP